MRTAKMVLGIFAFMRICGSEEAEVTPPSAAAQIAFAPPHGGVVVAADDAFVELVAQPTGDVKAYVLDDKGDALPPSAAVVASVDVQGTDGRKHAVPLTWNPAGHFAGHAEVQIAPAAPAEMNLVVRGQPRHAVAPTLVFAVAPPSVEVTPPSVRVRAPSPRIEVVAAAPEVVVVPPAPPRASVVIAAPPPPSVEVYVPAPPRPTVVIAPPRPTVTVVAPTPPSVVVEARHGRGHAYGHRGRGGSVVVAGPTAPVVHLAPPSPGHVVFQASHGHGHHGRGRHDRD